MTPETLKRGGKPLDIVPFPRTLNGHASQNHNLPSAGWLVGRPAAAASSLRPKHPRHQPSESSPGRPTEQEQQLDVRAAVRGGGTLPMRRRRKLVGNLANRFVSDSPPLLHLYSKGTLIELACPPLSGSVPWNERVNFLEGWRRMAATCAPYICFRGAAG